MRSDGKLKVTGYKKLDGFQFSFFYVVKSVITKEKLIVFLGKNDYICMFCEKIN